MRSFRDAKANARKNTEIKVPKSYPTHIYSNQEPVHDTRTKHRRSVRFFDEPPLSPTSLSVLRASRQHRTYEDSAKNSVQYSFIPETAQDTTKEIAPRNSNRRWFTIGQEPDPKNGPIPGTKTELFPSFISDLKDAFESPDTFLSLTTSWLNAAHKRG